MNKPILPQLIRPQILNFRECYPADSPRHPYALARVPSDALCVLWLDTDGAGSPPRFAYLSRSRAQALHRELGRILRGEPGNPGAVLRTRAALHQIDPTGEAAGA